MRTRHLLVLVASACLGLGLVAAPTLPAGAAPPVKGQIVYHVVDVGTVLAGASDTVVNGVIAYTDPSDSTIGWRAVGTYRDTTGRHGFLADVHTDFTLASATTIDVADSPEVHLTSINAGGTISGYYRSAAPGAEVEHGFLRAPDGTITALDNGAAETATRATTVGGAAPTYNDQFYGGTYPMQVADNGTVTGFYSVPNPEGTDPGTTTLHGFTWTTASSFTAVDVPNTLSTDLFGTTSAGLKYGGATISFPKTDLGTNRGVTLPTKGKPAWYVDTATPNPLPGNWCGWTTVTGAEDASTLVGDAGNGCSINGYAWLLRGNKYTDLTYTDATTTATETIATGITTGGIITGSWSTWYLGDPGGNWLSPDGYDASGANQGRGWWYGFIAVVS